MGRRRKKPKRVTYHRPAEHNVIGFCKHHKWHMSRTLLLHKTCGCKENSGRMCKHFRIKWDSDYWTTKEGKKVLEKGGIKRWD